MFRDFTYTTQQGYIDTYWVTLLGNSKETEADEELQTGSNFLLENPLGLQKAS